MFYVISTYFILYVYIFPICLCQRAVPYNSILTGPGQYNVFFRILSELVFGLRYTITKNMPGQMAVYVPVCHPQNRIWTSASLRSIYYLVGDIPVHSLMCGPQCHELFVKYNSVCNVRGMKSIVNSGFCGIRADRSLVFCEIFCRSLFVLFLLTIVLSVLQFTVSDYPFDIFKLLTNSIMQYLVSKCM